MNQKNVSFEIAKVLKEAGYPQPQTDEWGYVNCPNNCYFTGSHSYLDEYRERRIEWDEINQFHTIDDWADEIEPSFYGSAIAAPTYLDVWLWLWREKNIQIVAQPLISTHCYIKAPFYGLPLELTELFHDAEDAIIAGINHLVENDLIK